MTNKGRVIKRVTQSPVNASQWCFELECGHGQWVTMKTRPKRKRLFCRTCDDERKVKEAPADRFASILKSGIR